MHMFGGSVQAPIKPFKFSCLKSRIWNHWTFRLDRVIIILYSLCLLIIKNDYNSARQTWKKKRRNYELTVLGELWRLKKKIAVYTLRV